MLIKTMELENFRQFFGVQRIDFADDKQKNVTVLMGENTSGKTTLAQAFQWCFYGKTKFRSHEMFSIPASQELKENQETVVRVTIRLIHNNTEYAIERKQIYKKDALSNLHYNDPVLTILRLASDGQTKPVDDKDLQNLIQEILPSSLSGYFFFDGERIDRMSKEIQGGRSKEFAEAVKSLLGLNAITEAVTHLKNPGSNSVVRYYSHSFDSASDNDLAKLSGQIEDCENEIARIRQKKEDVENEKFDAEQSKIKYHDKIVANSQSKKLGEQRKKLEADRSRVENDIQRFESALLVSFQKRSWKSFLHPLAEKTESMLQDTKISDKNVPGGINADTVSALIERGECICGTKIAPGSPEFHTLTDLYHFVPPEALGTSVQNYRTEISAFSDETTLSTDIADGLVTIRNSFNTLDDIEASIQDISSQLEGMEDVAIIEEKLRGASRQIEKCDETIQDYNMKLGMLETQKKRFETERSGLDLTGEKNKQISRYLDYAEYMYKYLKRLQDEEETKIRSELQDAINNIFQSVFRGSFNLELDDKYNVSVTDEELSATNYDPETSEAQSIAVIFAFIAGVIQLARGESDQRSDMLLAEAYPLVMDAPLSNFDKKRIKAVCDVMPRIAEQVILFIKDTDGELAEKHMKDRLGARYDIHVIEQNRKSSIERRDSNV